MICADVAQGCDAVLLDLHGAMVTESHFDGEGTLLKNIRSVDSKVPIGVALDFHTNLTQNMVENSTVLDGYRTYPHIDMYETGERVADSLFKVIANNFQTSIIWKALPMMTHMIKQTPSKQPMKDIMDEAILSVDGNKILNTSVFGGFPLADIPYVSLSVAVVSHKGQDQGMDIVNNLCDLAWERRHDFVYEPEPMSESITKAKAAKSFPVVIADHGDNTGAGGSADDMHVLAEMINQGFTGIVAGPIADREAVKKLLEFGIDKQVKVEIGGKVDAPSINQKGFPLLVKGKVSTVTNGKFKITGPMQTGLEVNLGRTVVLENEQMKLVVCEQRWEPYDPGCFTHAGIDLVKAKYILVKSRQHFRAGFKQMAADIILVAGPGVCSSDYSQFGFKNLMRPIYPLDLYTEQDIK